MHNWGVGNVLKNIGNIWFEDVVASSYFSDPLFVKKQLQLQVQIIRQSQRQVLQFK